MALALLLVAGTALYAVPLSWLDHRSAADYSATAVLSDAYTHILLMGIDRNASNTSRSDTMIVASVGRDRVVLSSIMRDTEVRIPGRNGTHKINAAYAYGGPTLAVRTVNQNFGLNITGYAVVDYESFPDIVDAIGTLSLAVSEAEMAQVNHNIGEVLYRWYKDGKYPSYDAGYAAYQATILTTCGEHTSLNGLQALGYARIRNLDSDYGRTNRQRKVLSAMVATARQAVLNPFRAIPILQSTQKAIQTNLSTLEILAMGLRAVTADKVDSLRLPVKDTFTDNGSMLKNVNYEANTRAFLQYVYGT